MVLTNINKIFMIGDLHFGVRNNSLVWVDDMFDYIDKFMENLPTHGFNPETDILMLTGDIFHSREFLNVMIGNKVLEIFGRMTKTFKRGVFVILGNHDLYYKRNNKVHTLKFIEQAFDNFHVFSEPERLALNDKINFLMLPWHDDIPMLDEAIASHTDCEYLFCHMDISEFKYNKSRKVDKGVSRESVKRFKKIYAGHLHHKQESGNILYLGSPYHMDWGDSETQRGYYVVSVVDDMLHDEFFVNNTSPTFVACAFEDIMNMNFEHARKVMHNNYVSINIPTSAARNFAYNMFLEMTKSKGIQSKKLEFTPYDDSYGTEDTKFVSTADFNMVNTAKTLLEDRKYSHAETENILAYFNELHTRTKNNDKDER